jgi:hypothetical protein
VNWYVAALNKTEYNSTPIFIYNANPLNCDPAIGGSTPVVAVRVAGVAAVAAVAAVGGGSPAAAGGFAAELQFPAAPAPS